MSETPTKSVPFFQQISTMKWNFWICNTIEAFERLAFFGVRAVLPLYMYGANSKLDLTMTQKGQILGIWAFIQCIVPMVSGGYTDSYGYRKSMYVAFLINIVGYLTMGYATGFWSMLGAACLVGTGTAIFKPPVQGAVAKSLDKSNSGLGFGIFYWMVNVGGFFAPRLFAATRIIRHGTTCSTARPSLRPSTSCLPRSSSASRSSIPRRRRKNLRRSSRIP